jgi:glycosyltransferase involved in cell wall biosynthesis
MKILNVNSSLDSINGGGTVERTIQMSWYLSQKKDVEVSILTLNQGLRLDNIDNAIKIITIPCINKRFCIPFIFSRDLPKSIKMADVVHLMGHWAPINLIAFFWIQFYRKPYVVCPAGALQIFGRSRILKNLYNLFGGIAYIRKANVCIAITEDESTQFTKYGADIEKILLLPNGIEPKSYIYKNDIKVRKQFMIGSSPFLLFVGRLNLIKGPDLLLKAFLMIEGKYPKHKLIFAGLDDGMEVFLKDEVNKNNMSHKVRFIGFVEGKSKSELYHAADLLVIPSRFEAMSIVVLESAITETPVLMTNTCGLNQMNEKHGAYIVKPDSKSISTGLIYLLADKKDLELRGKRLKKYVEIRFDWNIIVDDYIDMYKKII